MKGSKFFLSGLWPDYLTDPWSGILIPAPPWGKLLENQGGKFPCYFIKKAGCETRKDIQLNRR